MINGRTFDPNSNNIIMLEDSVATEHPLNDRLIPGLKDRTMNPTLLNVSKTIITAGNRKRPGNMPGII